MNTCTNCGNPMDAAAAFCGTCGARVVRAAPAPAAAMAPAAYVPPPQSQPPQPYQPEQSTAQPQAWQGPAPAPWGTPPVQKQQKLSGVAKAWCWFGIVVNLIAAGLAIALLNVGYDDDASVVMSVVAATLAICGYVVLLCGKKPGFFLVCGAAVLSMVGNIIFGDYGQALLNLLAPAITWLLLKDSWAQWGDITEANKARAFQRWQREHGMAPIQAEPPQQAAPVYAPQQPYAAPTYAAPAYNAPMYAPPPQANPQAEYFYRHGRKFKIWSIVNTCMFFIFVLPIIGIVQSNKAQKAATAGEHQTHIRWAMFCNLATYGCLFLMALINGIITSFA